MATPARKPAKAAPKAVKAPEVPAAIAAVAESVKENTAEALDAVSGGASEIKEVLRATTEKTIEQTRAAYERMKSAAEEATVAIEATCARTSEGVAEISGKALDAIKANVEAQFDFFKALMAVKTPAEALTLQNEFLRTRMEAVKEQVADLSGVAQRVAKEAAEPMKSTLGKSFSLAA